MSKAEHTALPSYEESIPTRPVNARQARERNLSQARIALVSSLIATHMEPTLQAAALSGLPSSTLVLVPSNITTLHPSFTSDNGPLPTFTGEKILVPSNTPNTSILRIREPEYSLEFLGQPAVLQMLKEQLCLYLDKEGYTRLELGAGEIWSGGRGVVKAGGNAGDVDAILKVRVENVSLRIESNMGLYETRSGQCLIVRLDVKA